jgi:hypothetical protein
VLNVLAFILISRYDVGGEMADMDRAIVLLKEALETTPTGYGCPFEEIIPTFQSGCAEIYIVRGCAMRKSIHCARKLMCCAEIFSSPRNFFCLCAEIIMSHARILGFQPFVGLTVLALQSSAHPDLFPRLISSVFRRYSLCPLISIHHFHPSCLVSALLPTGYGPRRIAIDDFSRKPPLLSQLHQGISAILS